jgi:hypothetical protein
VTSQPPGSKRNGERRLPAPDPRDGRRRAAVGLATLLLVVAAVGGLGLLAARAIGRGLASIPDLRGSGAPSTPAAPGHDAAIEPGLRGRILDADGNPVAGASVRILALTRAGAPAASIRDERTTPAGAFAFTHLGAMRLRVAAEHEPEGVVTSAVIALAEEGSGASQELTLVLAPTAVRGDVVDGQDRPLPGVTLSFEGAPWFTRTATTDDRGAFRITAVPLEATAMEVAARGFGAVKVDVTRSLEQPDAVVHVKLSAAAPVRGDVLDVDGTPIKARVFACANQANEARTESADDGTFELPASVIGCDVVAQREERTPSDPVPAVAGRRLTLRLTAPGAIEGTVVDEQGRPAPQFSVSIEVFAAALNGRPGRRDPQKYEDPRGAFRLEKLEPGRYILMASAPGKTPTRSEPIDVSGGATTRGVRIEFVPGGSVTGHVFDERRAPIAGVALHFDLPSSTFDVGTTAVTDGTGAYRIDGAPAGPFTLRANKDGYRTLMATGLRVDSRAAIAQDIVLHAVDGGQGFEFGGIGANVGQAIDGVTVNGVGQGDPAERAGLRVGDRFLRVDGDDAEGLSLIDVIQRLRGPAGTSAAVTVQRGGDTVDILIPRGLIVR